MESQRMAKHEKYMIYGYDAFGNSSQETIIVHTKSLWQRALWRTAWFFGIRRWSLISKIVVKTE
jgi:hypothetical protein